jgi:hypothetical protein
MKKLMALILAAGAVGSAVAQPSVGVSIGINQPGVYGRINIGEVPPPALVVPQPVLIAPARVAGPPVYLYVPPFQQQNWRRYCGRYNACGQPVYFVREDWVRDRYMRDHPDWDHRRWDRDHHWDRRDAGDRWDRDHDRGGRGPGDRGDRGDRDHDRR